MQISVIGFGLIGGSALLAWQDLRRRGVPLVQNLTTVAMDLNPETLRYARENGLADRVTDSLDEAVKDADLILVAVPPGAMRSVFAEISRIAKPNAIVSDVASVRAPVVAAARGSLRADLWAHYVPLHPIAGSEKSGITAATPTLFDGAAAVLTPLEGVAESAITLMKNLWEAIGARIVVMSPDTHDRVYALVSHAPHLIAYAMMRAVRMSPVGGTALRAAGGGFRDFTRIAQADPSLWRDIFIANRKALLETLDIVDVALKELRQAVEEEDVSHMMAQLTEARDARRAMAGLLPPMTPPAKLSTLSNYPTVPTTPLDVPAAEDDAEKEGEGAETIATTKAEAAATALNALDTTPGDEQNAKEGNGKA